MWILLLFELMLLADPAGVEPASPDRQSGVLADERWIHNQDACPFAEFESA